MEIDNNPVWASGLVIGLIVFGSIFFASTLIAAIVCYVRHKKNPLQMDLIKRCLNFGRFGKSCASSSSSILRNKNDRSNENSESSNSTQLSTISLSPATVVSLQTQYEHTKTNFNHTKDHSTVILKSSPHSSSNDKVETAILNKYVGTIKMDKRATLVLNGNADYNKNKKPSNSNSNADKRTTAECIQSVDNIFDDALTAYYDVFKEQNQSLTNDNSYQKSHIGGTSSMAQQLYDYLTPRQDSNSNADVHPNPQTFINDTPQLYHVERRNKKIVDDSTTHYLQPVSEPVANMTAVAVNAQPVDDLDLRSSKDQIISKGEKSTKQLTRNKMTLIKSNRGSFMPADKVSKTVSILTENKWDEAVDFAFQDLA